MSSEPLIKHSAGHVCLAVLPYSLKEHFSSETNCIEQDVQRNDTVNKIAVREGDLGPKVYFMILLEKVLITTTFMATNGLSACKKWANLCGTPHPNSSDKSSVIADK